MIINTSAIFFGLLPFSISSFNSSVFPYIAALWICEVECKNYEQQKNNYDCILVKLLRPTFSFSSDLIDFGTQ